MVLNVYLFNENIGCTCSGDSKQPALSVDRRKRKGIWILLNNKMDICKDFVLQVELEFSECILYRPPQQQAAG